MTGGSSCAKYADDPERIYWDFRDIVDFAREQGGIISAHAGRKANGIDREITNSLPFKQAVKEEYAENVDIFEIGDPDKDIPDYENHVFKEIPRKPLILCSDNHDPRSYYQDVDKKGFLWIKADPTFNGLKQILYEPECRVSIGATKPEVKPSYQVIKEIAFNHPDFQVEPLPLNDKLNCIIGGKSTGKSILLHNIASAVDPVQVAQREEGTSGRAYEIERLEVRWADGKSADRRLVYILQNYLNRLVDDPEEKTEIDDIVGEIAMSRELVRQAREVFESEASRLKAEMDRNVYECLQVRDRLTSAEQKAKDVGNEQGVKDEIERLKGEQASLASTASISEDELKEYEQLTAKLNALSVAVSNAEADMQSLAGASGLFATDPSHIELSTDERAAGLASIREDIQRTVDALWASKRDALIRDVERQIGDARENLGALSPKLAELQSKIDQHAALNSISKALQKEEGKLTELTAYRQQLDELKARKDALIGSLAAAGSRFLELHQRFAQEANGDLQAIDNEITIEVVTPFRSEQFMRKLRDMIDNRKLSQVVNIDDFKAGDYTDALLRRLIEGVLSGSLKLKQSYTEESALREIAGNWHNVTYAISLQGDNDTINTMSPGKKAATLLKLLIKLADEETPILIDQPEDDLDNRSVWDELIGFIKRKKVQRQIIVVTHNANIVLGCDAEEVIVANQDAMNAPNMQRRFEYKTGSIEDNETPKDTAGEGAKAVLNQQGIQQHICAILEGGDEAFRLRKDKYRIS